MKIKAYIARISLACAALAAPRVAQAATQSSLLWNNVSTGQWATWNLSGNTVVSSTVLTRSLVPNGWVPPQSQLVGDGPLIFANGVVNKWTVTSNGTVTSQVLPQATTQAIAQMWLSNHYEVAFFDQSAGPGISLWEYNSNGTFAGQGALGGTFGDPGIGFYRFSADFNNDGFSDLLSWDREGTGQIKLYLVGQGFEGDLIFSTETVSWTCGAGCAFQNGGGQWFLEGAGDINGDGFADLVWWNFESGQVGYWELDGSGNVLAAPIFNWTCDSTCQQQWQFTGLIRLQ